MPARRQSLSRPLIPVLHDGERSGKAVGLVVAIAAGLIGLPILAAFLLLSDYRADLRHRATLEVEYLVGVVADGMRQPVWNLDPAGGASIVGALEPDPRFVSVEVTSAAQGAFVSYTRPGDPPAELLERRAPVVRDGQQIGEIVARIDPGALVAAGDAGWTRIVAVVALQLLFSLGAVVLLVRLATRLARNRAVAAANRKLQAEIEERNQFADALQKSEQHLRNIVNALPMSVFYVDTDLCIQAANRVCQQWWGRSESELLGARYGDFYNPARTEAFARNVRQTFAGNTWQRDAELEFPNGVTRAVEILYVPDYDAAGTVRGVFVITQDVTQRTSADRALAAFRRLLQETIDAAPVSITIKDREQRYIFANRAALEKFGRTREQIIGRTLREALSDVTVSDYLIGMALEDSRIFDTGEALPFTSFSAERDGEWCDTFLSKTPIRDDAGEVSHIVTVSVDVTELKRAEAAALAAKEDAELANAAKSMFLANMSHELRTPLNAIIGFSEVMMNETFGPLGSAKYVEYARDIHASGDHLHTIITDLLDVSRIEVGAVELMLEEVDLGTVLDSVCTMLERKARRSDVDLLDRCERPLPPVNGDPARLRQVFINLVDNAIKFTDRGGEVVVSADTATPGIVAVSVSDTGIGIDAADIERVVEPFVHLQTSMTRNVSGTGLGLSLVKSLTEMHGGELRIVSDPGNGTVVTVELPCAVASARPIGRQRIA